jgi:mannose-6-phosphate isomerase-like protein (cupin superfamily)
MRFPLNQVSTVLFVGLGLLADTAAAHADPFVFPSITPDPNPIQLIGPGGESFTFLKTAATTGGLYTLADLTFAPGDGPLPHIHHNEDEWFYILSGQVQVELGNQIYGDITQTPGINLPKETLFETVAGPGTLVFLPKDHVHTFLAAGATAAEMFSIWAPGGEENFFQAVAGQSAQKQAKIALQFGISLSTFRDQYVSAVVPGLDITDNHGQQLLALLAQTPAQVPEPSSWLLAGTGFIGVICLRKLRA